MLQGWPGGQRHETRTSARDTPGEGEGAEGCRHPIIYGTLCP